MTRQHLIQSVEISAIAHATEDPEKVQAALRCILPDSLKDQQIFTRRYLEGHHGNQIVTFDARLTEPDAIYEFTEHFITQLSPSRRLLIKRDLPLHSDSEGNLYLRIDKQLAFRGVIEIGSEEPIRIKMKFSRFGAPPAEMMQQVLDGRVE